MDSNSGGDRWIKVIPADETFLWPPGSVTGGGGTKFPTPRGKGSTDHGGTEAREGLSGIVGPVSPRCAGTRLAAVGREKMGGARLRYPGRTGAGADRRAR